MHSRVPNPWRTTPRATKPAKVEERPQPRQKLSTNALIAMGLWFLLWLGYNTGPWHIQDPNFPANTPELIHGVRAFFPMLAGWISLMLLLTRSSRVLTWIAGPMGLFVLFSIVGLATSVTLSTDLTDATYWGLNFISIILVLLAIATAPTSFQDLHKLLTFNWAVSTLLTFALLGAIPFMGGFAGGGGGSDVGVYTVKGVRHSFDGSGMVLGMANTRNTGFGRFAAVAALAGMARLRTGTRWNRAIWIGIFLVSLYALVLSNGRTEVVGFITGAFMVLLVDKNRRVVYFIAGIGAAIILRMEGFFDTFFDYFTRSGKLDESVTSMSGRTYYWEEGLKLFQSSPWVGGGFQADRIFGGYHVHNAVVAALLEGGIIGGGAIIIGILLIWFLIIKYFYFRRPSDAKLIPAEIPGVYMFLTASSVTESTFTYFSAAWLLSAPIVIYVLMLHRHLQTVTWREAQERSQKIRLARSQSRTLEPELDLPHSPTPGEVSH